MKKLLLLVLVAMVGFVGLTSCKTRSHSMMEDDSMMDEETSS